MIVLTKGAVILFDLIALLDDYRTESDSSVSMEAMMGFSGFGKCVKYFKQDTKSVSRQYKCMIGGQKKQTLIAKL